MQCVNFGISKHRWFAAVLLPFFLSGCDQVDVIQQKIQNLLGQTHANVPDFIQKASQNVMAQPTLSPQGVASAPASAPVPPAPVASSTPPLTRSDIEALVTQTVSQAVSQAVAQHEKTYIHNLEQKVAQMEKTIEAQYAPAAKPAPGSSSAQPLPAASTPLSSFENVAAKTLSAVVNVVTTQVVDGKTTMVEPRVGPPGMPFDELFKDFFEQNERPKRVQSVGSGFIVKITDTDAFIVTNYHVISEAKKISVILFDKTELDATMHSFDERTDLAVLSIKLDQLPEDKRKLATLEWGNSDTSRVGQYVIAIGNPFGLGSTVTSGIISGKGRDIVMRSNSKPTDLVDDFIQHDASLNMGNSGGVLLNMDGKVIGVNTAIFSPNGGSIGIGFAIPASLAQPTVDQLIEFGRTKRGWLGVTVLQVSQEIAESLSLGLVRGSIVNSISKDGPADKAGIQEHDIITEIDGKTLNDDVRLTRVVGETPVGKVVKVKLLRDGKELTLNVEVGEYPTNLTLEEAKKHTINKPTEQITEVLGMQCVDLPKHLGENGCGGDTPPDPMPAHGVLIVNVVEGSSAEDCGLRSGDIISEINMQPIKDPKEALAFVEGVQKKDPNHPSVLLTVNRHGLPSQYVVIQFKSLSQLAADAQNKDAPK